MEPCTNDGAVHNTDSRLVAQPVPMYRTEQVKRERVGQSLRLVRNAALYTHDLAVTYDNLFLIHSKFQHPVENIRQLLTFVVMPRYNCALFQIDLNI